MEPHQKDKEFYNEVDRSRYRSNYSCIVIVIVIGLLFLGVVWWLVSRP